MEYFRHLLPPNGCLSRIYIVTFCRHIATYLGYVSNLFPPLAAYLGYVLWLCLSQICLTASNLSNLSHFYLEGGLCFGTPNKQFILKYIAITRPAPRKYLRIY